MARRSASGLRRSTVSPLLLVACVAALCGAPVALRAQQQPAAPVPDAAETAPAAAAQAVPTDRALRPTLVAPDAPGPPVTTILRPYGPQYGLPDPQDPGRFVWVFLGGIEVEQGARRMVARTLVAVLARNEPDPAAPDEPPGEPVTAPDADGDGRPDAPPGFFVPDSRVLELYLDGDVGIVEGSETITGASAVHVDGRTGVVTVVSGELRDVAYGNQPLVARYGLLRRLQDGSVRMQDVSYTSCEHGLPHWHVRTPWATLTPTDEGRVLETGPNIVDVLDVPILAWSGYSVNVDRGNFLLRRLHLGKSSRFGTEIGVDWGGDFSDQATGIAALFGHDGRVSADWGLKTHWYSRRGLYLEPEFKYRTASSKGRLLGTFIKDSANFDHLDVPVEDDTRGRVDLEHRTRIGAHGTLDLEVSRQSDANYLNEFHEREFKEDKPQETYVSYRHVVDNHAWRVLASTRLNDFDTQVVYRPDVTRRVVGEPFLGGFLTQRDFVSEAALQPDDELGVPSTRNLRAGSIAQVDWPWDLGDGQRLKAQLGTDVTWFEDTVDDGSAFRYGSSALLDWSQVWSGTDSDVESDTWNFRGLRRIVETRLGYLDRFVVNRTPDELLVIDEVETLEEVRRFELGLRDRIQTHQGGRVVTVLDTDLRLPIYPHENRDNGDERFGPLELDTVWTPGANLPGLREAALRWRAAFDLNDHHYTRSYASYVTQLDEGTRLALSNNKVNGEFDFVTVGLVWTLNPKWAVAVFHQADRRNNERVRNGILLRQVMHCWIVDLELATRRGESLATGNNDDETRISLNLRPAILDADEDLTDRIGNRIW